MMPFADNRFGEDVGAIPETSIVDVYYKWFEKQHEGWTPEQITLSTNEDDIDYFLRIMKRELMAEFGVKGKENK